MLNGLAGNASRSAGLAAVADLRQRAATGAGGERHLVPRHGYANTLTGLLANAKINTAFPANNPLGDATADRGEDHEHCDSSSA